jgi:hypothetical protein
MKRVLLAFAALAVATAWPDISKAQSAATQSGIFTAEFTNPSISPSHWVLTLHRNGTGHFHAEGGPADQGKKTAIDVADEDRDVQLSKEFTAQVFTAAEQHNWFNKNCESHAKVAFQGWKKLSYSGPEGQGSCSFNYSQDKQIQALAESLIGLAETLREGARLELLLQHDRLGLDQEMEFITDSAKDGRLREISAIREILQRLAEDDELLERVRKRARNLLAQAGS